MTNIITKAIKASGICRPIGRLKQKHDTWRCAKAVIDRMDKDGHCPSTIIDCGSARNEWSKWLHKRWPNVPLYCIDPVIKSKIGQWHGVRVGACDRKGYDRRRSLDSLIPPHIKPNGAIIKVDCEQDTFSVLLGAKEWLKKSRIVVVEMCNSVPEYQGCPVLQNNQKPIIDLMVNHLGFDELNCVDACAWPHKVFHWDAMFVRSRCDD